MKKAVTNSDDLDWTVVPLCNGRKICEARDGSNTLVQQFIDELVTVRVTVKGVLTIHQAERNRGASVKDWNVVALTNLGSTVPTDPTLLIPDTTERLGHVSELGGCTSHE